MNIVMPVAPTVKTRQPTFVVADRGGTVDLYWQGFNAWCAGQTLEEQATREERNGWFWALTCQAQCEAPAVR